MDSTIEHISHQHTVHYERILRLLSTDGMIMLYQKFNPDNTSYCEIIVDKYRNLECKSTKARNEDDLTIQMIHELDFLDDHQFPAFIEFLKPYISRQSVIKNFCENYSEYQQERPNFILNLTRYCFDGLVERLKFVTRLAHHSPLIQRESIADLEFGIRNLPRQMSQLYCNDKGQHLMMLLVTLVDIGSISHTEIYDQIFTKFQDLLDIKWLSHRDNDSHTIWHYISKYKNEIFLSRLILHLKTFLPNFDLQLALQQESFWHELISQHRFLILAHLLPYAENTHIKELALEILRNPELLDQISDLKSDRVFKTLVTNSATHMRNMRCEIYYDFMEYASYMNTFRHALSLVNNGSWNNWLSICIEINEFDLFIDVMNKFTASGSSHRLRNELMIIAVKLRRLKFVNELLKYDIDLDIEDEVGCPLLIRVLESQNLHIMIAVRKQISKSKTTKLKYYLKVLDQTIETILQQKTTYFSIYHSIMKILSILFGNLW